MSRNRKSRPAQPARVSARTARPKEALPAQAAAPRRRIRLPRISAWLITFALLWFMAACYYGDVFYLTSQYSYFAFDRTLMRFLLQEPWGWLMATGRLLLTTFHYPALGGALLALMLTLSGRLAAYVLALPPRWRWAGQLVAYAPMAYFMYLGYNLFYQAEPSLVFTLPLVMLVVLALAALVVRLVSHRHLACSWRGSADDTPGGRALSLGVTLLLTLGLLGYAQAPTQQNTRLACTMQRLLEQRNWEGMRRCGLEARRPDRAVAAYYALALMQLDRLPDDLFTIHYDYPPVRIHNRAGEDLAGADFYLADVNLYSGLINPAYQEAMTGFVGDGPSVITIKMMAVCAALNQEKPLARRYFRLLRLTPFEGAFVERYGPLVDHPDRLSQYPELQQAYNLRPAYDRFEQSFRQPLFLGYYTRINMARDLKALRLSWAAALYTKSLPDLADRVAVARGQALPQPVEDALALYALQNPSMESVYPISPYTRMRLEEFLTRVARLGTDDRRKTGEQLRDEYANYYPYYFFFENMPEDAAAAAPQTKGGVN